MNETELKALREKAEAALETFIRACSELYGTNDESHTFLSKLERRVVIKLLKEDFFIPFVAYNRSFNMYFTHNDPCSGPMFNNPSVQAIMADIEESYQSEDGHDSQENTIAQLMNKFPNFFKV